MDKSLFIPMVKRYQILRYTYFYSIRFCPAGALYGVGEIVRLPRRMSNTNNLIPPCLPSPERLEIVCDKKQPWALLTRALADPPSFMIACPSSVWLRFHLRRAVGQRPCSWANRAIAASCWGL